jgi:hypothetical protein
MDGMLELLRLFDSLGEVKGRKKLQKIVHILQSCGFDFPQRFGYLHYGPYSSAVAAEVDALVADHLVAEDGSGETGEPYVYKPAPAARQLLLELDSAETPRWEALAHNLNVRDANTLEAVSTLLYLQRNGFVGKGLKDRFLALKPNLRKLYDTAIKIAASLPKSM